jgi:hypothetical protein
MAYRINPTINALELIFKGVRMIKIRHARENNLPMIVKTLCFTLQPDLSNSRDTTFLGKISSKKP